MRAELTPVDKGGGSSEAGLGRGPRGREGGPAGVPVVEASSAASSPAPQASGMCAPGSTAPKEGWLGGQGAAR